MNLQENIRRILKEDKKTKSTNKEFSKYKDSKFNSLRDYTLQDIVDDWDSLSDHKNENIKTIKHFVNNPDKITDLVYDEKGLEDGYHRLIAAKILKKPRFSYRLVENLQENIRRILREETILPLYIRRRVSMEELDDLVLDVKDLIDSNYDKTDAIYDTVRQFVATKKEFKFKDETEQVYWDSYIEVEEPLVNYVKTNLHESKEKSTKELITTVLNTLVLPQYKHVICGFELKNVDDESLNNVINYPGITVTFIGGKGTKLYPQTSGVQKMYDDVLDEIWDTVWDYTGISLILYSKYVKDCGKENIYLREQKEETYDDILAIKNILELTVMKDYEDLICDIDVDSTDDDRYKYVLEFTFLRKHEVRTIADYDPYLEIMDEAGNLIYDYTNIDVFVQQAYVKQCG